MITCGVCGKPWGYDGHRNHEHTRVEWDATQIVSRARFAGDKDAS